MGNSRPARRSLWPLVAGLLSLMAGCNETAEIVSYEIPKEPPRPKVAINVPAPEQSVPPFAQMQPKPNATTADPKTGPDRMLGAIVTRKSNAWFFKITGAEGAVAAAKEPFIAFLKAVEFGGENDPPTWTLPEGWKTGREAPMRFATLDFESDGQKLELAISSLPMPDGEIDPYLLLNLNRWLGQMGLPNTTLDALRKEPGMLETIELSNGLKATLANFRGQQAAMR